MSHQALQEHSNTLLDALNPEQRKAVEATQGAVLVLAGAGTGKTRVLTTRIAHILMNRFAFPGEILAVTFTNKAAREMVERVNHLTGASQSLWLGTFHSIGVRIIRRHAEKLGLTSSFTILDEDDQLRLLKAIIIEQHIDEKSLPPKLFKSIIQNWKDQGLTADKITSGKDLQAAGGNAAKIYQIYQNRLKQLNAADFGDLILHMITLFSKHEEVLSEYARRFKYILVDEYQDTNVAQYLWLRLLASYHKNLCCVGDDDQSIYSWRGAEVGNILRFERDFPDATVVRLECNYRSTPHILGAASSLIANNQGRLGKTLWTPEKEGDKIQLRSVWDEGEEARFIGEEIEQLQRKKTPLNQMAILVRAGFQTRAFEERFLTMGIPYRVVGGLRFYERAEIRDAVAYLRVIASPTDDLAFERIVNIPKRGIGQATMQQLHNTARNLYIPPPAGGRLGGGQTQETEQVSLLPDPPPVGEGNASMYQATAYLLKTGGIKGKLAGALDKFMAQCESWRAKLSTMTLAEVVDLMLEESGYRAMWQQEKTPDAAGRLDNLKELVRAMGEFETIHAFLEHVSLVTEATNASMDADMVSLMTMHAAKGLEFDVVFLPGWEEGLFPSQRSVDENGMKGLEEERRLAYVGITRARKKLYISHAANRRIYNQWQNSIPSRFIGEIPAEYVDKLSGGVYTSARPTMQSWKNEVADILARNPHPNPLPGREREASVRAGEGKFTVGARIFHQKFGYGRVQAAHGNHIEIEFEKAGRKKVLADFIEIA